MLNLEVNKYYDLNLYSNVVIGSNLRNAKLLSILSYQTAVAFSVDELHNQILDYLPEGTPRDHTKYNYYQFLVDGELLTLAEYWIDPDSINELDGQTYTITIYNTTSDKMSIIRDQLNLLGFTYTID